VARGGYCGLGLLGSRTTEPDIVIERGMVNPPRRASIRVRGRDLGLGLGVGRASIRVRVRVRGREGLH